MGGCEHLRSFFFPTIILISPTRSGGKNEINHDKVHDSSLLYSRALREAYTPRLDLEEKEPV